MRPNRPRASTRFSPTIPRSDSRFHWVEWPIYFLDQWFVWLFDAIVCRCVSIGNADRPDGWIENSGDAERQRTLNGIVVCCTCFREMTHTDPTRLWQSYRFHLFVSEAFLSEVLVKWTMISRIDTVSDPVLHHTPICQQFGVNDRFLCVWVLLLHPFSLQSIKTFYRWTVRGSCLVVYFQFGILSDW
jgi:hypothetical protein